MCGTQGCGSSGQVWAEDFPAFLNIPKKETKSPRTPLENALDSILDEIALMLKGRHEKYGPGNIAKHGPVGILVRMDDKFARLEAGQGNFDDETIENTLDDIIGYALIWKLWLRGEWPGSEKQ